MFPVISLKSKAGLKCTRPFRDVYCLSESETAVDHISYRLLMRYKVISSWRACGSHNPADQGHSITATLSNDSTDGSVSHQTVEYKRSASKSHHSLPHVGLNHFPKAAAPTDGAVSQTQSVVSTVNGTLSET